MRPTKCVEDLSRLDVPLLTFDQVYDLLGRSYGFYKYYSIDSPTATTSRDAHHYRNAGAHCFFGFAGSLLCNYSPQVHIAILVKGHPSSYLYTNHGHV